MRSDAPVGGSVCTASGPNGFRSGLRLQCPSGLCDSGGSMGPHSDQADPPAPAARRAPQLPRSCRVLLAEDGHDNQVLIRTFLTLAGATVTVVGDGQRAVDEAAAARDAGSPFDVILMDMQMPVLDGYGATSRLRQMGYSAPIVAITAHAMAGDRERCESAGCDDYLTKPVDRAQLTAIVARLLARPPASESEILSAFGDDDDMKEIVRQFVRDLPDRASALLRALQACDADTAGRMAHQLKGAAGGYGFPRITEAAAAVEQGVRDGIDASSLHSRAEDLARLCRRARAL